MDFENSQAVMVLAACCFLTLPTAIYCIAGLIRNWNRQFLIKRRRLVIVALLIMIIYQSLIEVPHYAVHELLDIQQQNLVLLAITVPTRLCCVLLINTRVWLLFFDCHYNCILATKLCTHGTLFMFAHLKVSHVSV